VEAHSAGNGGRVRVRRRKEKEVRPPFQKKSDVAIFFQTYKKEKKRDIR
jgi:hypothetical protein